MIVSGKQLYVCYSRDTTRFQCEHLQDQELD